MTSMSGKSGAKRFDIEATVIRADGTRVELGRIASTSRFWNLGLGRWRSSRRIRRANRQLEKED